MAPGVPEYVTVTLSPLQITALETLKVAFGTKFTTKLKLVVLKHFDALSVTLT